MTQVFVAIGSNYNAQANVLAALAALEKFFGGLNVSSVYKNPSLENGGGDYLNLVVAFSTALTGKELIYNLKSIEKRLGRTAFSKLDQKVCIDLDLILFGGFIGLIGSTNIPSVSVVKHSFVLAPLAEIAARVKEPHSGESYAALWEKFDKRRHVLTKVSF
ncbi:MAG: 2-amino-4-hydroxy-6-hydroxymethyldihydropteridine diphosphokinase [Oceanospirillaceae bacterium]|jgi:2-amino-4-hydroxy-6-hydroxymethyldihydropteridine diphosphokinase